MVKGHVSLQSAAVAAMVKSWWQPSFTLAASAAVDFASGKTRYGLTAAVETFKHIKCVPGCGFGLLAFARAGGVLAGRGEAALAPLANSGMLHWVALPCTATPATAPPSCARPAAGTSAPPRPRR